MTSDRLASAELLEAIPSPEPLTNLFLERAARSSDRIASYSKVDGRWVGTTWRESKLAVEEAALGLLELGAERGVPVAILSHTRREWTQLDIAIMCIGGITVGIYPSLTGAQSRQLLELSGARIVFVDERTQRVKIQEATQGLEPPVQIVTMEPVAEGENVLTLDELRRRGAKRRLAQPDELARRLREVKSSDVVSYIYTSGTTGEPKGAMLTHANFHYVVHATNALIPYANETAIAFLPLAHSLQRYSSYLALSVDVNAYYAESLEKVPDNLREVRPTCFALVPRILEKIHTRAVAAGNTGSETRRKLFARSLDVLHDVGVIRRDGRLPGLRQRMYARLADQMIGTRIRDRMGGRVKFIGSGGAPLARDVHEFFEDIGVPVLEGWGLTETSAPATLNTLANRRIGTVGRPLPGTDIRIAADGEILVRGPGVFRGYFQNDLATKEAFDDDGWFKTGDVGFVSRDGFLTITDRKKDLIITAGGKNIAPQPLENELKRSPIVSQAVVVGDRRPYLTALFALDHDTRAKLAAEHGLGADADAARVAAIPEVKAELEAHVARVNAGLPSFEQIKRFDVLPSELTIESGELTPTLKVKRRVITERYRAVIEGLYEGSGPSEPATGSGTRA
ncbi:long-chain fatty acid--CoA ligase [Myxococcota bacterium]|nr:long-chain fatty acid--CoA ligase [Myxococcota bacterium]